VKKKQKKVPLIKLDVVFFEYGSGNFYE